MRLYEQVDLIYQLEEETLHLSSRSNSSACYWASSVILFFKWSAPKNKNLDNQVSVFLEKLGSLSLSPEDSTLLLVEADTTALHQAITAFGSLETIYIPEQLTAHTSSSNIGSYMEQKLACSTAAVLSSEWLLGSKHASGQQASYTPCTNLQDWLTQNQTLENS